MTKKPLCFQLNRSVPSACQGNGGTSLTLDGSFRLEVPVFWHVAHLSTSCLLSLEMLIQYTWFLAQLIHFSMLQCPWWISSNILHCKLEGISILWLFRIIPFSIESSSLKFQNLCRWLRNFSIFCGNPFMMNSINCKRNWSLAVSSQISFSTFPLVALVTRFTMISSNLMKFFSLSFPFPGETRESTSATGMFLLGTHTTWKLYGSEQMISLWIHRETSTICFLYMEVRGFWSVTRVNSLPYRK